MRLGERGRLWAQRLGLVAITAPVLDRNVSRGGSHAPAQAPHQ